MAKRVEDLSVKIYADGADFDGILEMAQNPFVKGFTTNPTFVRQAGVTDYEDFGRRILAAVPNHPLSLEVFADDLPGMEAQARVIRTWGPNVNVKIPVMNTQGVSTAPVIEALAKDGIVLNVTAIFTPAQVEEVAAVLHADVPAIVSVFAGRVADTGVDPMPLMADCRDILKARPKAELLWASPREVLNIFQADDVGCQIITTPHGLIKKLGTVGKDLTEYSRESVQVFYKDAQAAGFTIEV